jgi:pimeloyl-ACP methyl ester carboxylesterase
MDRGLSMRKLGSHLQEYGSVTYDRRGYGHSRQSERLATLDELSFERHVEDLSRLVSERPSIVFGHSIGGTVALKLASLQPSNLLGVMIYESPLLSESWWPQTWLIDGETELVDSESHYEQRAEDFMIAVLGEDRWSRLPLKTRQARRAEGRTMIAEMISARWPRVATDFHSICVPVISAIGEYATSRHRRAQSAVMELLPNTVGVCIRHADHGAHLSRAQALAEILSGFALELNYH